jgi:hypothetical protein
LHLDHAAFDRAPQGADSQGPPVNWFTLGIDRLALIVALGFISLVRGKWEPAF